MYFDDLTPVALPAHVVDGLTEDLIDQLGETSALQVVSTFGTRPFRGTAVGVDSIRNALKVGTIITGSVASVGDSVRVNVRLVDATSGQQVATVPLAAASSDLLGLRRDLADRIAFSLRQRIGERIALRDSRATTKSEAAWEAVQLAANLIQRSPAAGTSIPLMEADTLYARAARLDRNWALPWVGRAQASQRLATSTRQTLPGYDSLKYWALSRSEQRSGWYTHALPFTDSALARDPRSWQALAVRGDLRRLLASERPDIADSLLRLAEKDLRAALAIRPDAAMAWTALASLLSAQTRYGEAALAAQRGYDADPFFESRPTLNRAFFTALYSGAFDNAQKWCAIALEHYASDIRFTECRLTLLGWSGRTAAAMREAEQVLTTIEQKDTLGHLWDTWGYRRTMVAAVAARAGLADTARALIARLHSPQVPDSLRRNTELGESYVMLLLGKPDSTIAILQRYATTAPRRKSIAAHPWFESLREDPRFAAIVANR
jgi:TolB-like protein